jgi:hypothetical protein
MGELGGGTHVMLAQRGLQIALKYIASFITEGEG